jgi:hypothetical protein
MPLESWPRVFDELRVDRRVPLAPVEGVTVDVETAERWPEARVRIREPLAVLSDRQ